MNLSVFFYCHPQGAPDNTPFPHCIVCLAEGLLQLGVPFYSNVNYWQKSLVEGDYLLKFNPNVTPDDCAIVVMEHVWYSYKNKTMPDRLFHTERKYLTVCIDKSDEGGSDTWKPEFRQFDLILKTHYNRLYQYPSNVYPWAFGLSERILQQTVNSQPYKLRQKSILTNFRVRHNVREKAITEFLPLIQNMLPIDRTTEILSNDNFPTESYDRLLWEQTGRRHYPTYYAKLKEIASSACFGGHFAPPYPRTRTFGVTPRLRHRVLNKLVSQPLLNKLVSQPQRLLQWDSWRLWESWSAGSAVFHADLEKYGALLPVMPQNWKHYVGVDFESPQGTAQILQKDEKVLERISTQGKQWAIDHYAPLPTAKRFLAMLDKWPIQKSEVNQCQSDSDD